jgi:predicted YcjX-like family ATPase
MYKEMAFISYYFHWSSADVMGLEHGMRRKWCQEISSINSSLSPSKKSKEKNIFEMKPDRVR